MKSIDRVLEDIIEALDFIESSTGYDMLKRLEDFKQECEKFGIYDERKSLAQLRWDLKQKRLGGEMQVMNYMQKFEKEIGQFNIEEDRKENVFLVRTSKKLSEVHQEEIRKLAPPKMTLKFLVWHR